MRALLILVLWLSGCCNMRPIVVSSLPPCNSHSPTIEALKVEYDEFNFEYFQGKLPEDVLIYYGAAHGNIAETSKVKGRWRIEFNPEYNVNGRIAVAALLHEMCHVAVGSDEAHGPKFKFELRRLMLEGAFDDVF